MEKMKKAKKICKEEKIKLKGKEKRMLLVGLFVLMLMLDAVKSSQFNWKLYSANSSRAHGYNHSLLFLLE